MTSIAARPWLAVALLVAVAVAVRPAGAAPPAVDVEVVGAPASPLPAAATLEVAVEVVNRGAEAWASERGYALAYHWFAATGEVVEWDGLRTPFAAAVASGARATLTARVATPAAAGRYLFQWDVVEEGVRWLAASDPTPVARVAVEVVRDNLAALALRSAPLWVAAGDEVTATAVASNLGGFAWPADGAVAVASHWRRLDGELVSWDGRRGRLPRAVGPGEQVAVSLPVQAPARPGRYLLELDLVREGVCWFSEVGGLERAPQAYVVVLPRCGPPPAAVLLTLVLAVAVWWPRSRRGAAWCGLAAVLDLLWLVASLTLKQAAALTEMGVAPSAAAWTAMVAAAGLVAALLATLPRRWRLTLVWVAAALATLVVQADLIHFRFFGDLVSTGALAAAHQGVAVAESIATLFAAGDLWYWLDLPLALALLAGLGRDGGRPERRPRRLAVTLALASAALAVVAAAAVVGAGAVSLEQVTRHLYGAREAGLLPYHGFDLTRALGRKVVAAAADPARRERAERTVRERAPLRAGAGPLFAAAAGRNLVMIQVESLQTFVLATDVGGVAVTPTLRRWAREGLLFAQAYDQTLQGRSSDAELLTQTSLVPPHSGVAAFSSSGNRFVGLASVLAGHGYETLSAVPFSGSFWNRRATHRAYGYRKSLFAEDFAPGEVVGWGLSDRAFFAQMAPRLEALPEPFCAWLLTLSLHHPFAAFPAALQQLEVGDLAGTPFGNYLHSMHFFDRSLAELEARLVASGLAERTLFVLWGDHDADFEWTPEIAARMGVEADDAGWVASQRIPIIVRAPGVAALAGVSSEVAGHVDVAPTVLALLGVDPAPLPYLGRNLLAEGAGGVVTVEHRNWVDDDHLFLNGGVRLEDGTCHDRLTRAAVPLERCAAGFATAAALVEASAAILEHDLQEDLGRALTEP